MVREGEAVREEGGERSGGGADTDEMGGGGVGSRVDAGGTDADVDAEGAGPAATDGVARELGGAAFWAAFVVLRVAGPDAWRGFGGMNQEEVLFVGFLKKGGGDNELYKLLPSRNVLGVGSR